MGAPIFWFVKLFSLVSAGAATTLFLWLDDGGEKGALGAAIYTLLALGLFFKDGFSLRQWSRRDFYGFNQALRWFGLALAGIAGLATIAWFVIWLFSQP